ncbi:MAG TPA: hypothetical protein PLD84_10970 [Chitinophagales bacterium]|nr:hypothetical protein [Chitinophagales bacterium]
MKTITILLASFLIIGSQTVFADSINLTGNCCPVPGQESIAAHQNQQLMLDQLQVESETMLVHSAGAVHEQVQKKVTSKSEEHESLNSMQQETESITVESLQSISQQVSAHVTRETSLVSK